MSEHCGGRVVLGQGHSCYWRGQGYDCGPACGGWLLAQGPLWTSEGRSDRPRSWRRLVTASATRCLQTPQKYSLSCQGWILPYQGPVWRQGIWRPPVWFCCAGRDGCDSLECGIILGLWCKDDITSYDSPNNEHRDILNIADTKNRNRIWNLA